MSVQRFYVIGCDGCFVELDGSETTLLNARAHARQSGWRSTPAEDLCSECLAKQRGEAS